MPSFNLLTPTATEQDKMASSSEHSILDGFKLDRILDQDPKSKSVNLLGTLYTYLPNEELSSGERAILLVEKTHFAESFLDRLRESSTRSKSESAEQREHPQEERSDRSPIFSKVSDLGQNDIYTWLLAWFGTQSVEADVKITLIRGATQAHIDKYSAQRKVMVYETPEMYQQKVLPWIESFPPSRIQWVYNILEHKKEADSILFEDPDPKSGFIVVPDLKWDQKTTSSLYIQVIVHNRGLKSIRDLTKEHIGMLENIKNEASRVAFEKYGLTGRNDTADGNVRCFLHYHPSYYHLHVHVLASSFTSHPGAVTGQAHLLDDVVDLLKLGIDMKQRTLGYILGTNSKLWDVLYPAQ